MKTIIPISQSIDKHFRKACQEHLIEYTCIKEAYYKRENEVYQDYELDVNGNDLWFLGMSVGIKTSLESSLKTINEL